MPNNEWWFVITDVVTVLTDSVDASDYLEKLRKRDPSLGEVFQGGDKLSPLGLEFETTGGTITSISSMKGACGLAAPSPIPSSRAASGSRCRCRER
jgi:hypothetical protein